jgi:hypothetical protein
MSTDEYRNRTREGDFPAINISRIKVGGDLGGLVFVVGTVVCLLIGLPETRTFFAGTLAGGGAIAAVLAWWRRRHHGHEGDDLVALGLGHR